MKKLMLQDQYPVFVAEIAKADTPCHDASEVVSWLKRRIEEHEVARHIASFDHLAHTRSLENGQVGDGILAAWDVVFCFGTQLPKPEMLAIRPRAIGVAEYEDHFVVSFMEAPMKMANDAMRAWIEGISAPEAMAAAG